MNNKYKIGSLPGRRNRRILSSVMMNLLLLFGSSAVLALPDPCHPLYLNSCLMPYPSNHWTEPSEESRTGRVIAIDNTIVRSELLAEVSEHIWPERVLEQGHKGSIGGFSPATAVLFELSELPNAVTLPSHGGESVLIFDTTTGQQIPIQVRLNPDAVSNRVNQQVPIIEARPLSRFDFGHTYIAVVTHELKTRNGSRFLESPGMISAKDEDSALFSVHEETWSFLADKNIQRENVLWVSEFTIRNETDMITPYAQLVNRVFAEPHPIRNLTVEFKESGRIAAYVRGEIELTQFRSAETGWALDRLLAEPIKIWAEFYLVLPRSAVDHPAPIAIYGHGVGVDKSTLDTIAITNVNSGIATIGIDYPNHGTRRELDGGKSIFSLGTRPSGISAVIGIAQQAPLDLVALVKALTTEFAQLDVLPAHAFVESSLQADGIGDLDLSRILYQGTSLGGVFGTGAVAWAPEIQGAFFQVTGAGITHVLQNTILWPGIFDRMVPDIATPQERVVLINLFQHMLDPVDGINLAHWYRDPFPGLNIREKSVLLHMGIGDAVVDNVTSAGLARVMKLPLFAGEGIRVLEPVDDLATVNELPFDGSVLIQTRFPVKFDNLESVGLADLFNGFFAHLSFVDADASNLMTHWFEWMFYDAPSDPAGRTDAILNGGDAALTVGNTPEIDAGAYHPMMLWLMLITGMWRFTFREKK